MGETVTGTGTWPNSFQQAARGGAGTREPQDPGHGHGAAQTMAGAAAVSSTWNSSCRTPFGGCDQSCTLAAEDHRATEVQ